MRRLFLALVAVLLAWIGVSSEAMQAVATPDSSAYGAYTYDAPFTPGPLIDTAHDRGPPKVAHGHMSMQWAVGVATHRAAARVEVTEAGSTTTCAFTGTLVQVARPSTTTGAHAGTAGRDPRRAIVAANTAEHAVPIGPASEGAWATLNRVDAKGSPLPDYKGGSVFRNEQGLLPETPGVTYREWDVNPNIQGVPRDAERIVTGSDGSAYWTTDHYDSFTMFRGPTG